MLALYIDKSGCGLREVPDPEPGEGEALIRVLLAGVCATDLEIIRGYMKFRGVLGHEFVGEVAGPEAHPLFGQRVVGEINCGCRKCRACRSGMERHCAHRTVLGILGRNGAFAEYLTLPTSNLHIVPDGVDNDAAVFCEPIAACLEVMEQRPDLARGPVLVLGDGRLGLLQAQVLRAAGAEVTILGRHSRKLALLDGLGIRTSESPEEVRSIRNGGWPAVVEATGSARGFEQALSFTAPRGVLVLKSTVAVPERIDLAPLVVHEISLVGSRCGPFAPALKMLAEGRIRTFPMIDARFPLSQAPAAIERAGTRGTLKVMIAPRDSTLQTEGE